MCGTVYSNCLSNHVSCIFNKGQNEKKGKFTLSITQHSAAEYPNLIQCADEFQHSLDSSVTWLNDSSFNLEYGDLFVFLLTAFDGLNVANTIQPCNLSKSNPSDR